MRNYPGAACVMTDAANNSADATDPVQAAIDTARRARQDKIPSFRRLLEALAVAVGSHLKLAVRIGLPASRLSESLNDHTDAHMILSWNHVSFDVPI